MTKRKTTVYIDEDLLRAARVRAARDDRRDSDVFEAALSEYLGLDGLLERIWARNRALGGLDEDEAMELAREAQRWARESRPDQRAGHAGR